MRSREKRSRSSATAISASSARASRRASLARRRPPISSHSAPVAATALVVPQNSPPSGSVSASVAAASAVIATTAFALSRPDSRTAAADAVQTNIQPKASSAATVRATEIASIPATGIRTGRRVATARRNSGANAASPTATRTTCQADGSDSAKSTVGAHSQKRPKTGAAQRRRRARFGGVSEFVYVMPKDARHCPTTVPVPLLLNPP